MNIEDEYKALGLIPPKEKGAELWLKFDDWPELTHQNKKVICTEICNEMIKWIETRTPDHSGRKPYFLYWKQVRRVIEKA